MDADDELAEGERHGLAFATTEPARGIDDPDAAGAGADELAASADTVEPMDDIRPQGGLSRARRRAALASAMFGVEPEPVRIGRFVILGRVGQGGMGAVYSAYDPKLDRRVAVKLLRMDRGYADDSARERLEREAMALAKLSHPNVVPVHDVGSIQSEAGGAGPGVEQMFIVMELVEGQTLQDWTDAEPRSWPEIVRAYRQAGEGLAAAHAVDLVHRDFKPGNVQVGEDGRVRVLDFGLARSLVTGAPDGGDGDPPAAPSDDRVGEMLDLARDAETAPPPARRPGSRSSTRSERPQSPSQSKALHAPLTRTGAFLGTPAYMSPEQFASRLAGPASDQFSFCLALYEALYGSRPFAGTTFSELAENTLAGRLLPQPRAPGVPGWLYPIIARGLAADPDERYPSMAALLAELGRDRARARARRVQLGLVAGLLAALIALSVYAFSRKSAAVDPCTGGRQQLAGTVDDSARANLEQIFADIDHPYVRHVWPRVAAELERYTETWVSMHEGACRAHRRGEQSGRLLDLRMACLERRQRALGSAVTVLAETRAESLDGAVEVVHNLPDLDYCADEAGLLAQVAPPESPEVARSVSEFRARASRAQALSDAGRYSDASAVLDELMPEAELLGYRPLSAELHLLQGRLRWNLRQNQAAISALRTAVELGLSAGMSDLSVEALARLIYAEGVTDDGAGALARLSLFEALAERTPDTSFVRALFYNNVGVVYRARQEPEFARQYLERALAARGARSGRTELAGIAYNLVLITDDYGRRDELLRGALAEFEHALGPIHPRTLKQRVISAPHILSPVEARAVLEPACTRYDEIHPELRAQRSKCLRLLADLDVELGHRDSAARHYRRAAELSAGERDKYRDIARGLGALYGGDSGRAIAILTPVLARLDGPTVSGRERQWWEMQPLAVAALGLGLAHLQSGDRPAAVAPLERARESLERLVEQAPSVARAQQLARTRIALARAPSVHLWLSSGPRARRCARAAPEPTSYGPRHARGTPGPATATSAI